MDKQTNIALRKTLDQIGASIRSKDTHTQLER